MWAIRFLSGPLAGQTFNLKTGRTVLGRASQCDIQVASQNISKEHAVFEFDGSKLVLRDLNSRNGTFVNGVQVRQHNLQARDKIGFFDIVAEIVPASSARSRGKSEEMPQLNINAPANDYHQPQLNEEMSPAASNAPTTGLPAYLMKYIDEVVLPGVYKLGELMEFRILLALFVAGFIILVTSLSTIPLMRILKSSIEKEAQNRAQTIARIIVRDNRNPIMQGQTSLISVDSARNEPGVNRAFVISSSNGEILAPAQLVGQYITDLPYVNEARKRGEESVSQIDSSTIVALAPIKYYNPNTGAESVAAHSVVVYDMGALAVDDGRTLSLFVQILFIASIIGSILYFFLYKLILFPISEINKKVDQSLRDGSTQISTSFIFPELQHLASNINSAIHRGGGGFGGEQLQNFEADRSNEIQNIVQLVGFAAITIHPQDKIILSANEHFLNQIGTSGSWTQLPVDQILDQALKLNLQSLIERVQADHTQIVTDQLDIADQNYHISAQGLVGAKDLSYILVVFVPHRAEGVA